MDTNACTILGTRIWEASMKVRDSSCIVYCVSFWVQKQYRQFCDHIVVYAILRPYISWFTRFCDHIYRDTRICLYIDNICNLGLV